MAGSSISQAQRAVWGWGTSFDDEEARAFLAQRVALYARQVGMFFAVMYLLGVVVVAARRRRASASDACQKARVSSWRASAESGAARAVNHRN